ncbi:prepilin-type N-terminal cleavage/methylation domain-containing protein [Humibacter sp.]|uniref:prepilin-type N-terminal cleavage/methylation domain-containing protein n=1 Tax=Humibacter sp. TaxID=1940291 RepID=UPI002CB99486|nr:prepilin-type N-terminal cleavage/methylation domain-containing protein [Humibacter sp.]HVX08374.1 prepilin-type N-terminal cleavage/methylation domain-containing protein [Humibacter sp.]
MRIRSDHDNDEGFTLIELLVVIIIIGILAAIAIPVFLNQRKKGYEASLKADMHTVALAEETYLAENPDSYATGTQLVDGNFVNKVSSGNNIGIYLSGGEAFCFVAFSSKDPTHWYAYDSVAGGMQPGVFSGGNANTDCPTKGQIPGWSLGGYVSDANGSVTGTG